MRAARRCGGSGAEAGGRSLRSGEEGRGRWRAPFPWAIPMAAATKRSAFRAARDPGREGLRSRKALKAAHGGRRQRPLVARGAVGLHRVERAELHPELHERWESEAACRMRERQLGRRDEQAVARAHERSARKKGRADVADCAFYGFGRHLDRRDDMDGIGCEREVRPLAERTADAVGLVRPRLRQSAPSETERFSVCKVEPIEGEHAGHAFDLGRSCRSVAGGDGGPAEQGVEPARTPALRCGGMRDDRVMRAL